MGSACGNGHGEPSFDQGPIKSAEISRQLTRAKDESEVVHILVMFGLKGAGKSTVFKQFQLWEGNNNERVDPRGEGMNMKEKILSSIVREMQILVVAVQDSLGPYLSEVGLMGEAEIIESLPPNTVLDPRIAQAIEELWSDPKVKEVSQRAEYIGLSINASYFFDDIRRFAEPDYVPIGEDFIQARTHSSKLQMLKLKVENDRFLVVNLGNQMRSTRAKWIHSLSNTRGLMYVCSLSDYDQCTEEDPSMTKIVSALHDWSEICNSEYFTSELIALIILFNKVDIFQEKIKSIPLTNAFSDYTGPTHEFLPAYEHISGLFEAEQSESDQRPIFSVCQINTNEFDRESASESIMRLLLYWLQLFF